MAQLLVAGGSITGQEFVGVGAPASRKMTARRSDRGPIGGSETRMLKINWADIDDVWSECFPAAPALPGTHPTRSYLYVESVEISPWPEVPAEVDITAGDVVDYATALATIVYSTLPYDPAELLRWHQSGSNEVVLLPSNSWYWEASPAEAIRNEDVPAAKFVPIIDHTVDLFRVSPSYESTIISRCRALIGKVNRSTWRGADAETVLFEGYDSDSTFDSSGNRTLTFSYRFRERRLKFQNATFGWNHFPRQDASGSSKWQRIIDKAGNYVYPWTTVLENNFESLLTL